MDLHIDDILSGRSPDTFRTDVYSLSTEFLFTYYSFIYFVAVVVIVNMLKNVPAAANMHNVLTMRSLILDHELFLFTASRN